MTRRLVLAGLIAVAALGLQASPAGAHARLEQTTPAGDAVLAEAPTEVVLRFTEAVDPGLGGVKVIAPDGSRADRGRQGADGDRVVRVPIDADVEGTYTVAWSVLSEDSHTIAGSFVFSVGRATGAADLEASGRDGVRLAAGVARWAAFAGTIVLVGAIAFGVAMAGLDLAGRQRRLARLMLAAAVAAAVGSAGVVITQVALASGRSFVDALGLVGDAVRNTRFGALGLTRTCLAAGAAVMVGPRRLADGRAVRLAVAAAAAGLLVVPGLAGHAWTVDPRWAAVLVDAAHLAAASVWVGGLAALLVVAPGTDAVAALARRFSTMALGAVVVVVATGAVSGYLQVRSVDALTATAYGKLLIVKVVAVAGLVTLGWVNRRRLLALLPAQDTLFGVVRAEVALAVVVLAVTSVLVNRPPGRDEASGPFATTVRAEDAKGRQIQVQVDPARAGQNDIHLYVLSFEGLPSAVDAIEMTVGRAGVPPRRVAVTPVTPDHASAYGVAMPSPGAWTLVVTAVREGQPFTATIEVPIR